MNHSDSTIRGHALAICWYYNYMEQESLSMEKNPPIRNEKIMQVMIACTDRNTATAANSLTSPAPIPFRKYTGNKMPRDTITEAADVQSPCTPP